MQTITLAIIVKNEEKNLDNCLSSIAHLVDEVVIVDTGSTDNTKEIASKYTDKIYDFEWNDDFASARNYAFSKAKSDFIMWLDADDILLPDDQERFTGLRRMIEETDTHISMIYDYSRNELGESTSTFRRNRIIKNTHTDKWKGFVHEYLDYDIETSYKSAVTITHTRQHSNGTRNLDIFLKKRNEGFTFSGRDHYYFGRELMNNGRYDEAIIEFKSVIDLVNESWIEDVIGSFSNISECHKLLGDFKQAREWLFKSMEYTTPRIEIYYKIGELFMEDERWKEAIYYFERILEMKIPSNPSTFFNYEYTTWRPRVQLSICYYKCGDFRTARSYNQQVLDKYPTFELALNNEEFFKSILDKN